MSEEEKEIVNETKQLLENLTGLAISERFNNKYAGFNFLINSRNVDILIKVIEKQQTKIEELESYLYSANCIIDDYIDERNKLKNKMIGDKMEQFDDYIIYLIESYLEILEK